jgi:serine/threonine protein phosphatase PrpC
MVDANCVQWKHCREFLNLVPTQSLGHRGITGLEPSVHIIDIQSNDEITVIIGSDGLWDMICEEDTQFLSTCSSAEELCKFAEDRWKQEWNYIIDMAFPDVMEKTSFDDFDDITVGIYKKQFKR